MMIKVEQLYFDYPGMRALDNVSLEIEQGSIVALVGPNGAGKSTLLRCMAALEQPFSGHIWLDGNDVCENPRLVHEQLGYLSDFFGLYEELTVTQCLHYHAASHGIGSDKLAESIHRAADRLGLTDRLEQKAKELSRGLRQRLAIAQAIVHEPKMLLLDEPASGLDPEARHELAALFCQLRDQGMTLLVSSHILAELEEYSTHMVMLRHGKIMAQESIGQRSDDLCEMQLTLTQPYDGLFELLQTCDGISEIHCEADHASFTYASDLSKRHGLLKILMDRNVPIASFAEKQSDMHQAYLDKVKQQDGEASL